MKKILRTIDQANPSNLFWLIVGSSIILAAQMQAIQNGWINPDSVFYLEAAKLIVIGDFKGAYNIFSWPFYALCIGTVSKLTGFGVHLSAQFLNMLFFGIATASFLKLIKLSGGNNRSLFFGMLLLFSSLYIVGDILEMLMRDEGFWAFYLTSLVYFIRYIKHDKSRDAILWQVSIIIATLFRIEAILYLLLLPLATLWIKPFLFKQKILQLFYLYSLSIMITLIIGTAILTQSEISMAHFGRLNEVFSMNIYYDFTQQFLERSDRMSEHVLGPFLEEFAIPALLLTFIYVIGSKILTATGWIGTGLALITLKSISKSMPPVVKISLLSAASIALLIMLFIITKVFVLSSRYVIGFAWIMLIFASIGLSELSKNLNKKIRIGLIVICIILSLSLIKNILPKAEGYNYMQDAVSWIKSHNKNNEPVFYDETRMIYYADEPYQGSWNDSSNVILTAIENESVNQFKFLALSHSVKNQDHQETVGNLLKNFKEIKRFSNRKGRKSIIIYKKIND